MKRENFALQNSNNKTLYVKKEVIHSKIMRKIKIHVHDATLSIQYDEYNGTTQVRKHCVQVYRQHHEKRKGEKKIC